MRRPTPVLVLITLLALWPGLVAQARAQQPPPANPAAAAAAAPQVPATSEVPGVRNFTRVDATIACGGALSGDAISQIKQAGFKSIVNLRAATEEGANVEAETRAARDAGLRYIWLPFVPASPDPAKVDQFLAAVVDPLNQPMLIHCTSGGRASMFWAIKRVMVDGWPVDKAIGELPDLFKNLGASSKGFVREYLDQRGKTRDAR